MSVAVWEYFSPDTFPSVLATGWILMIAPRGMLILLLLAAGLLSQL